MKVPLFESRAEQAIGADSRGAGFFGKLSARAGQAQRSALVIRSGTGSIMNRKKVTYRLGDMVRIKAGPFAAFTGKVEGINQSKTLLNVKVQIFGRVTPIKVNFSEAEKLEFRELPPPPSTEN